MKEFKTDKSKATYYRVLDTALNMFREKGFEKTTMRGLSKEAKLGLGALYYYFPSKESIVLAFYERLQESLAEEWPQYDPGETAELKNRLQAFVNFKLEKLEEHRSLMRILLKEAVDPESPLSPVAEGARPALDLSLEIFKSMLTEHAKPDEMAKLLWMGHLGVIALWIHRPQKAKQAVEMFADMAPFLAHTLVGGEGMSLLQGLWGED